MYVCIYVCMLYIWGLEPQAQTHIHVYTYAQTHIQLWQATWGAMHTFLYRNIHIYMSVSQLYSQPCQISADSDSELHSRIWPHLRRNLARLETQKRIGEEYCSIWRWYLTMCCSGWALLHVCMYMNMQWCVCACMYVQFTVAQYCGICVCVYECMYNLSRGFKSLSYACMCICMCMCTYVATRETQGICTYMRTCIHTCTYKHIYVNRLRFVWSINALPE
jgi:hypothetical protein